MERAEDAGVYKLTDDLAIIQTLDFFTPIVDDPYSFGQVAAANALSDVYAMGGRPLTAMNIACFPIKTMDISVLNDILAGGLDKVHEAGAIVVGGHTVEDDELKYGLSVSGVIHPQKVALNTGAKVGDRLILTKPLGTGIISTAVKGGVASASAEDRIVKSMATLNQKASELMQEAGIHAATDITGFGLLGHASEMMEGSDVGMIIHSAAVPLFSEAREYAEMGMIPGGLHRNREFRSGMVAIEKAVPEYLADILFDPQTSGGLFIAVAPEKAEPLLEKMHQAGIDESALVGEVIAAPKGKIIVD
ncbi:MAG: selenide, water dikinase [Dehalococcoidia bacterium SG8_51_3]|nr:MAG: selenide, water dikinase [Dehalococcoidia bacterium SG8_51_3]